MTEIDILCKAKEVYRRCFDDDYKYPGVLNAIRIAVEETNKECAKKDLENWKVLEKNYDDLYERTRWHFPAKGEYPENRKIDNFHDYNPLVLVFMYRYDDYGKAAEVYALDRWESESERWQNYRLDKIVAWQYLPEEPKEAEK